MQKPGFSILGASRHTALHAVGASVPECFRLTRRVAAERLGVSGIQPDDGRISQMLNWIPANNTRE